MNNSTPEEIQESNTQVYVLHVDMQGYIYRVSVLSEKTLEEVLEYFYQYSPDVRHITTDSEPYENEEGIRETPVGTIVACRFSRNKIKTFGNYETPYYDKRHTWLEGDLDEFNTKNIGKI